MNSENTHQDVITCPVCHALIVGASACPDPRAHEHHEKHVPPPAQPILYGGQQPPYRSWYRMDDRGRAMITFRAHDGTEKEYPVLWGWIDPVTGKRYEYMIDLSVLGGEDLLIITGMSKRAFEAISARLPGRTGSYAVQCETTEFVKEWLFRQDSLNNRWKRPTRREKRLRHRPECSPRCRKAHRGE